jgi:Predicted lipoprotein of unknown function (DUF2380)
MANNSKIAVLIAISLVMAAGMSIPYRIANAQSVPDYPIVPNDHHVFPQQFRDWFAKHGIDVDEWTVRIEKDVHISLHSNGWNQEW